jgi:prolyl oligopeptidase
VSRDAKRFAYQVSTAGSDWSVWRFLDPATGKKLDDELKHIKFGGGSWSKDGRSFYYSRYPAPKQGEKFQALNLNQAVYLHRLGTPQSEDKLVYHNPKHPEWGYEPMVTEDGRYLILTIHVGTDSRYRITVIDLREPDPKSKLASLGSDKSKPILLIDNFKHEYTFVGNTGSVLYFKTDLDATRKRLISFDLARPELTAREIIPEEVETLESVSFVGGRFIASYLQDVKSLVKVYTPAGKLVRTIDFPGIGSASGFEGLQADTETFYTFESYATPPTVYRYDVATGKSTLYYRTEVPFDSEKYTVEQIFYKSKDGTRVPMFVIHRKGINLDGSHPTVLYGYGGFTISLTPRYSLRIASWLELGGVFAVANLRGGGEYGETWHKAGTKLRKQNVFDDFIAAAETLIEKGYTRTDKLAIMGGSNGGLLVGAVMTQRPDLFGACLPAVGVMDMLRFHKFTAGRFWTDDYGSSDNPDEFRALLAYSPYHNLKKGTCYPATLITTADTDDRVVPGHSFKFAAALQHAQSCDNPVLIRIETEAGHGMGKPTSKQIDEMTDLWAFLFKVLKVETKSIL